MITLATLPQATAQEVYNQVKEHLLKQKVRCQSDKMCLYRNSEGLKCAAGVLISDEEYQLALEGVGTWEDLVEEGFAPPEHMDLIKGLQELHDYIPPENWEEGLKDLASEFNLNP